MPDSRFQSRFWKLCGIAFEWHHASGHLTLCCGAVARSFRMDQSRPGQAHAQKILLHQLRKVWPQCDGPFCDASFKSSYEGLQHICFHRGSHIVVKSSPPVMFFFFTSPWWALSESDCSQTSISRPPGAWFQVSKRILKALWHSFRMTPCIWASDIVGLSCGPVPLDGPVQAWSSPAKMTKLHQLGQVWPQCDGPFCNAPFCSSVDDLWGERTLTSLSHWCEKLCTFNQTPFWAKMEVQLVPPKIQIWTQSGLPWGSHGVWGLQGPLLGHKVKV